MADEPKTEEPTEETKPKEEPTEPHGNDEPDWKAEARKWESRAKENKDAAAKLKELEDAQKTEQERLTDKLTETETRAKEAELRAARLEVATEKGLPKTSIKFLTGTTAEELSESADELLSLMKPSDKEPSDDRPKPRLNDDTPSDDNNDTPEQIADKVWKRTRGGI